MNNKKIKISPSILSADFGRLNENLKEIEEYVDLWHIDVMDGNFVNNISFGEVVIKDIKSKVPLDVHLMIDDPYRYIEMFAKLSPNNITFHVESKSNVKKTIELIKSFGIKVGLSLNPDTSIEDIKEYLKDIDLVLIMSVNPGFGAQSFIKNSVEKIRTLKEYIDNNNLDVHIEVDGGINDLTVKKVVEAGANILVSGSYIFGTENKEKAIESLRLDL